MYKCIECGKEYKQERWFRLHMVGKHGYTGQDVDTLLFLDEDTPHVENAPETREDPGPAQAGAESGMVPPEETTEGVTSTVSVTPPFQPKPDLTRELPGGAPPQAVSQEQKDDETMRVIMADPVGGPLLAMIREIYAELQALKGDTATVVKDINDSIMYLKEVPAEPDLIAGFDRVIEKYGWQDTVKRVVESVPAYLDRLTGGDPVTSDLGPEFMERMKQGYLEEQERRNRALGMLEASLARGERVYTLSAEEEAAARQAGFIKEEPQPETVKDDSD